MAVMPSGVRIPSSPPVNDAPPPPGGVFLSRDKRGVVAFVWRIGQAATLYTAGPARTGVCTLASRRGRLCTLRTSFWRGFAHWSRLGVHKVPPERPLQCAKSRSSLSGQCTNPLRNTPSSVQSPHRLLRARYKPLSEHVLHCVRSLPTHHPVCVPRLTQL